MEGLNTKETFAKRVKENNTYFFHDDTFEEKSEIQIKQMTNLLLQLRSYIGDETPTVEKISTWMTTDKNSLTAILTLIGLSRETLLRLVSFIRIKNDIEIDNLVNRNTWPKETDEFHEWSEDKLLKMISFNEDFRKGVINLLFWGSTKDAITKNLPLFEHSKLSINKFKYNTEALLDTIVRYKFKGSYSADKLNNPENLIINILNKLKIPFEKGRVEGIDRMMDFIIPSTNDPKMIIESSYVVTTSSGQGDKAKTEQEIHKQIQKKYPDASFFGFVDGLGWLVREGDLKRMVSAYDDVFTFKENELERFSIILRKRYGDGFNGLY